MRSDPKNGAYWLSASLRQIILNHGEEESRELMSLLLKACNDYKRLLKKGYGRLEVANYFLELVDKSLKHDLESPTHKEVAERITCKKGCSYCCKITVHITDDEAAILYAYAKSKDIPIDKDLIQEQLPYDTETWHNLSPDKRSCVFLDEKGECKVYPYRPMGCRKYLVITDPAMCDFEHSANALVGTFLSLRTECVSSGVMNACDTGTLPQMLHKIMEKERRKIEGKEKKQKERR